MKRSIFISIVICGLLLCACKGNKQTAHTSGPPKSDVEFAKEAFRLLSEGDESVTDMIDWEHLMVQGMDAGEQYRAAQKEDSGDNFSKGFINGFSNSYKKSGASVDIYSNWREQSRDSSNTIVAADGPAGKVMTLTVAHIDGQQKLSAFSLK